MSEWDKFLDDAQTVDWNFNFEDEKWRCDAKDMAEGGLAKEEENHFYHKENSPSGANFFASISRPIFVNSESIDKNKSNVEWRFSFGDAGFRHRALTVPSCVHIKEMEMHEYHKKKGSAAQKQVVMTKPKSILKPIDSGVDDDCVACKPPVRLVAPNLPCLPPLPPPSCCIPYPNALSEQEWHNIRKEVAGMEAAFDMNESALYERAVKTCDPCMLPQGLKGRHYKRPEVNLKDDDKLENMKGAGKTSVDVGECVKRETRGPGIYPYKGYLPTEPLSMPGDVPCGYHFSEKEAHTFCTSTGGGAEEEKPKLLKAPPPPPCPPKVKCPDVVTGYCCPRPCAIVCCSPNCGPC